MIYDYSTSDWDVCAMAIGRRELLGFSAVAMAAALTKLAGSKNSPALFQRPEAARAVGARYLALYPEEGKAELLDESLFAQGLPANPAALRRHIGAMCRRDFAAGETVIVDGWILARSEARACALVSLGAFPA